MRGEGTLAMADLKNSQRVTYKATYNQISPTVTIAKDGGKPPHPPFRAVEKTAFIQSMRIIPQELTAIQRRLAGSAGAGDGEDIRKALTAIGQLINDDTATSTLNNAALFASVDPATLVLIAHELIAYRQTVAAAINKSIADILSA